MAEVLVGEEHEFGAVETAAEGVVAETRRVESFDLFGAKECVLVDYLRAVLVNRVPKIKIYLFLHILNNFCL